MPKTKGLAWLLTLVMAAGIAGCGGGQKAGEAPSTGGSKAAPAAIKIGGGVPLTGKYSAGGNQVKQGYELAVEEINAAGGIMVKEFGKKIPLELTVLDDESDPTKTIARMETLNDEQKVTAYLGGFGSDMHAAAAAIAEKNKTPYLGIAFSLEDIHKKGYKYLFSPFPKSTANATILDVLGELVPGDQAPKTIAIFEEKTDWGKEQTAAWKAKADALGMKVVVDEQFTPGSKDYTDLITKAKNASADVLLGVVTAPDGMAIAKQVKELGYVPKAIMFPRGPDGPTWGSTLKEAGDNYMFAPGWYNTAKFPGVDKLNADYQKKYNKLPDAFVGPAYACVKLLADAIERAGTLDRSAIRDALSKSDLDTVVGHIKFDATGISTAQVFFNQWQNGKAVQIWPKEGGQKLIYPAMK